MRFIGICVALLALAGGASAEARGGYLHRSDAMRAVTHYAAKTQADLDATSATPACHRTADRRFWCEITYTDVVIGDGAWSLIEPVTVALIGGRHIAVSSLLFANAE